MTENKDKLGVKDKDQQDDAQLTKDQENDGERQPPAALKEQPPQPTLSHPTHLTEGPPQSRTHHHQHSQSSADRCRKLSHFLDILNIPRHYSGGHSGSSSSNTSAQHSPLTPHAVISAQGQMATTSDNIASDSGDGNDFVACDINNRTIMMENRQQTQQLVQHDSQKLNQNSPHQDVQHRQQQHPNISFYSTTCLSFQSEIVLLDMTSGEIDDSTERSSHKEEFGTQRVYKKTSPNCVLTLYLPSREIILSGNSPSLFRGIVYVDPKSIHGYRVYAQLTLTFRYGREDEEVMGLRFCNEAIMSIHQIWPRNEEPSREALSPLQEALLKRLGDGAHPFTLSLTAQAPPSVQLVPAKRYYGAPIGTSYDVRCFIADKTDEKFHRRASVKMGVRVIYRTDVFNHSSNGPEHFADLVNNPASSTPATLASSQTQSAPTTSTVSHVTASSTIANATETSTIGQDTTATTTVKATASSASGNDSRSKSRKSERGDSFPKLRLSPKAFRFSSRFGRSKSEVEKYPTDPFHNYSKSFQEYDSTGTVSAVSGGGPQGAVDKPFLLQDGRVGLRASLDKAWYTHGEEVCVTINIRNDSRKTVRKVRVCAIQHVDVCMFNNGKFKNVVADSDNLSPPAIDRTVPPGGTLNTTVILRPQRGPTKNWIALEDTLQRSTEPEDITGAIAASAIRTPHFLMQANQSPYFCTSPGACNPPMHSSSSTAITNSSTNDERNVFAIYVSYYVKVKLTLSGIGGELSLKLPFLLVHIDEEQAHLAEQQAVKLALDDVPAGKKNGNKTKGPATTVESCQEFAIGPNLERIESVDERNVHIKVSPANSRESAASAVVCEADEDGQPSTSLGSNRRRQLVRSETIGKDLDDEHEDHTEPRPSSEGKLELVVHVAQVHTNNLQPVNEQLKPTDSTEEEHTSVTAQVPHELSINQSHPVNSKPSYQ